MNTSHHHAPNWGISMSGGGVSAIAYLGFIEELRKAGYEPKMYAGLSGGSIVSVLLGAGLSTEEAVEFFKKIHFWDLLHFSFHNIEIFNHHKLKEEIYAHLPVKRFEDLKTPAIIFASDLVQKVPVIFETGDIASAILASCSLSPFMQPVRRRGKLLGDGGYTVYYGAQYLRDRHVKKVIGVDVSGITERSFQGIIGNFYKQINAALTSNARYELHEHPVDLDVQIKFPMPNVFNFHNEIDKILATGRKVAHKHLDDIHKLVH